MATEGEIECKTLKNNKTYLKSKPTRFKRFVDSLVDPENVEIKEIELRIIEVQPSLESFNNTRGTRDKYYSYDNNNSYENEIIEFENTYFKCMAKAKNIIENAVVSSHSPNSLTGNSQAGSVENLVSQGPFDLNASTNDTFYSLIHDNASIANVQKFHYLRLSLTGPAADLLKTHVKALFDLELNKHLRALKVLKQPVAHWDALIIHMVSLKLKPVTRKEWEAEFAKHDISLDILTEFLHESVHSPICTFCKQNHTVYNCQEFLSLSLKERNSVAKKDKWCLNCLRNNHATEQCRSQPCKKCSKRHTTLLRNFNSNSTNIPSDNRANTNEASTSTSQPLVSLTCRGLLDSGSESNFITECLCKKLNFNTNTANISVNGIGQTTSKVLRQANLRIQARQDSYSIQLNCLVLPKITRKILCMPVDISELRIASHLILADPSFNVPNSIDILIGCDIFWDLLCTGQIKLGTVNGIQNRAIHNTVSCNFSATQLLDMHLARFWEIEGMSSPKPLSIEEQKCENNFKDTTFLNDEGRFVVTLPLKHETHKLEYEILGHMSKVTSQNLLGKSTFYLPHHCVTISSNQTTKLRVVFDGSSKSSCGCALNDILLVGPTVQQDLFSIVFRARKHPVLGILQKCIARCCYIVELLVNTHLTGQMVLQHFSKDR
ncbi:hypothetical protein HUJ05_001729 [Dendroctonus ponderosae]|nr:hypothetical protein HUJ05_001729 [Dendroctonus ponderosae]